MKMVEKITNMYSNISNGGNLSTRELLGCGFSSNDLTKLVRNNFLIRSSHTSGYYTLIEVQGLYEYGINLQSNGENLRAYRCFKSCVSMNSFHEKANFQLFLNAVISKKYEIALNYMRAILHNSEIVNITDYDMFIFLLSFLTKLPFELAKRAKLYEIARLKQMQNLEVDPKKAAVDYLIKKDYSRALMTIKQSEREDEESIAIRVMMEDILSLNCKKQNIKNEENYTGSGPQDILEYLQEKHIDRAKKIAHIYLKSIGMNEYEDLIIKLIDLYTLESDSGYMEIMVALSKISNHTFILDTGYYIGIFEESLHEKNYKLAKRVLGIIGESKEFDQTELLGLTRKFREKAIRVKSNDLVTLDEYYEVEGIQLIMDTIATGKAIDATLEELQANAEQKALVYLIMAKEAYETKNFKIGDVYMKKIEKMEKTDKIKTLFNLVRQNKMFFQNRPADRKIPFVILLK